MRPDLVIGIDSSTTATKAIAFDARGRIVAEGRAPIPLSNPHPGWFEQEVSDWTGALTKALKQLSKKIDMARVAGLAISNQRESFAQFDAKGKALRPGTLWLDERAQKEVKDIAAELGAGTVHHISGKPADVTPCLYRCRWLSTHMPKVWAKTATTAEVHGVLTHFLTGQWATSTASADPMGLLDVQSYDWSDVLLKAARLRRDQMPILFRPGEVMGEVTPQAAKLTGLKPGTPVIAGGGDGQCAGTGANTFLRGRAYVNLGTAAVSGSYGKHYAAHRAFRTMMAVGEEGFSFETAIRTGTFLVNWMVERLFNVNPGKDPTIFKALETEAAASPIGAHGLVLVPYWSGVMTPYWDSAARGVIAGLSGSHSRGDVYRALLEGVALEQAMMTNQVADATTPITHFAAVGGGSRSDLWCQILADASAREVKRLETAEASALGAAMAAAKGAGWFKSVPQASAAMSGKPSKTFRPRKKNAARYQDLLVIYSELWPKLSGWNQKLADFSRSAQK
ncbi:MAG: FGGY-family carbohydrate kinase [Aestuariivirga sp.]|uniref:xylulokinase n=1 Tax=Aestuariivirga sp. TaxID=2650926 RepID=UPI0025BD54F5|nr:FGGY-family carbohydrate kinase [Aestuariivirga sp.]MCA3560025.1 FGGY-family carbohydrate kinase [Aestuariivirga sp.]